MISRRGTRTGVASCQLVKRLAHSGKGRPGSDDSHNRLAGVMVRYHGHRLTQATWGGSPAGGALRVARTRNQGSLEPLAMVELHGCEMLMLPYRQRLPSTIPTVDAVTGLSSVSSRLRHAPHIDTHPRPQHNWPYHARGLSLPPKPRSLTTITMRQCGRSKGAMGTSGCFLPGSVA